MTEMQAVFLLSILNMTGFVKWTIESKVADVFYFVSSESRHNNLDWSLSSLKFERDTSDSVTLVR